ncbi:MAG TPA: DUF4010 domain-containing protein, partial [Tepidisphaeraceae bacterium]|nr:DUF4010 domain-containing protein [Tepidisphaeraceae bacterium]
GGHYFTTAMAAIVMTGLLAWKTELAKFAGELRTEEIRGAVLLGLLGFVVYPLLPNHFVDPWKLFNPRQAWVIVIVIAGIGFLNYVLLRLYGKRGLHYAALLGGLVNSTATAAELSAAFDGTRQFVNVAVAVVLLSDAAMFVRNGVILAIFASAAALPAVGPLCIMMALSLSIAWLLEHRSGHSGQHLNIPSPVSLWRVLRFALIFVIITAAGTLAQRRFGGAGFIIVSVVGGIVSSASATAAAAALVASHELSPDTGGIAASLASASSIFASILFVYQQTRHRKMTTRLMLVSTLIASAGLIAIGVEWLVWIRGR